MNLQNLQAFIRMRNYCAGLLPRRPLTSALVILSVWIFAALVKVAQTHVSYILTTLSIPQAGCIVQTWFLGIFLQLLFTLACASIKHHRRDVALMGSCVFLGYWSCYTVAVFGSLLDAAGVIVSGR
jgi:hypothetical protein